MSQPKRRLDTNLPELWSLADRVLDGSLPPISMPLEIKMSQSSLMGIGPPRSRITLSASITVAPNTELGEIFLGVALGRGEVSSRRGRSRLGFASGDASTSTSCAFSSSERYMSMNEFNARTSFISRSRFWIARVRTSSGIAAPYRFGPPYMIPTPTAKQIPWECGNVSFLVCSSELPQPCGRSHDVAPHSLKRPSQGLRSCHHACHVRWLPGPCPHQGFRPRPRQWRFRQ